MPTVQISLLKGRTREVKREIIARITDVLHEVAQAPKEAIVVVLHEVSPEDYGRGGVAHADK